jgi:hypothetical protein
MGIIAVAGFASALAGSAVDAYRSRLQAQIERRRLGTLQVSMVLSGSLATVGMIVDAVALQARVHALHQAVEEAVAAGDLYAAEKLRAQLVAALEEPPASARLMATLAEYYPALVARYQGEDSGVIEGHAVQE